MKGTFHEEGSTDEAVRGAHQAHDGDLLPASQDSQADGVVDEDQRDEDQEDDQRDADIADVIGQLEEALHRALTVLDGITRVRRILGDGHVFRIGLDGLSNGLNGLRICQLNINGGRKRIGAVELLYDLRVGGHGVGEVLQSLLLGGEGNSVDILHVRDGGHDRLDVLLGCFIGDVGSDGDLALNGLHEIVEHGARHEEQTDDEQRQEDGDDGPQSRREVAREALEGFLEEIADTRHRTRTPPDPDRG